MGRKSTHGLPPHMRISHGASGKTYYYFERKRTGNTKRRDFVPLGPDRAEALKKYTALSREERTVERAYRGRVLPPAKTINAIRQRAKRANISFSLTTSDLELLMKRAKGRCELTGTPFDISAEHNGFRRAWRPSVDRIDSRGDYSLSNCRLVCIAANVALNDFGEDVFDRLARGYIRKKYHRFI